MGRLGVLRRGAVCALLAAPFLAGEGAAAAPSALDPGARLELNREVLATGDTFEIRGTGMRGCGNGLVDVTAFVQNGNAYQQELVADRIPMNESNDFSFTLRHTFGLDWQSDGILSQSTYVAAECSETRESGQGDRVVRAPFRSNGGTSPALFPRSPGAPTTPLTVVAEPSSGPPGTPVMVWATGTCANEFGPERSAVNVLEWDGHLITSGARGVEGSAVGQLRVFPIRIPTYGMRGEHTITAHCYTADGTEHLPTTTFTVLEPEVTVSPPALAAGSSARVTGRHFTGCAAAPSGTAPEVTISQGGRALGRLPVAADGGFSGDVTIPQDALGATSLAATCAQDRFDGTVTTPLTVTPASAPPPPSPPQRKPEAAGGDALADGRAESSVALPQPADLFDEPTPVVAAAATTAVALPLIGFGAELVNRTVERNRLRIRRFFHPGGRRPRSRPRVPALQVVGFVLLSSVFAVVAEPAAGFDRTTVLLALAMLVAVPVGVLAYAGSAEAYRRRASGVPALPSLIPGALGLTLLLAVLSRVADLTPGYVFGLILAFTALYARHLTPAQEGKAVAIGAWALALLATAAWVARIPVRDALDGDAHPAFGVLFVEDVLTQLFVAGVVGLVFGLVPLRLLDGELLWSWSRFAWAVTYAVAAFLFVLALTDPAGASDGGSRTMLLRAAILFGAFLAGSVAFWSWFRFRPDPNPPLAPPMDPRL